MTMTTKKTIVKTGFFIKDVPLNVFKRFKLPCQEEFGDTYWVRLKDLLDKEDRLREIENGKQI